MLVKFLFFLAMAVPAAISVVELEEVCVEREALLGRALEVWEKKIIGAFLQNERYKNMSKAERDKVPGFSKIMTASSNKLYSLKRRPDFREDILPPKKVAKTVVERMQKVGINIDVVDLRRSKPIIIILRSSCVSSMSSSQSSSTLTCVYVCLQTNLFTIEWLPRSRARRAALSSSDSWSLACNE